MTAAGRFFGSSIGKKVVMAVTGFVLFGFVVAHMVGQPAGVPGPRGAQRLRRGAARLSARSCGRRASACWSRSALHIWAAYSLTMMNRAARPQDYREKEHRESTYASRTMRWSGVLLLLFIVYHLMHLTWGNAHPDFVHGDVYHNFIVGFRQTARLRLLHRGHARPRPAPVPRRLEHPADARPEPPALQPPARTPSPPSSPWSWWRATSRCRSPCWPGWLEEPRRARSPAAPKPVRRHRPPGVAR